MYLGTDPFCAFIETFGQSMARNGRGISVVAESDLGRYCLCMIDLSPGRQPLRLVDLTGAGLSRLGADARLNTMTEDRGLPQRWALVLHRHPQRPDGLCYRVRHDPAWIGVALFDRARDALRAACVGSDPPLSCSGNLLARPDRLRSILAHYRCALIPPAPF